MNDTHDGARMRVPLTPQWWAAFVAIPLVVGLGAAFLGRNGVESSLQTRVERSVLQAGVSSVGIAVDGQDVKATVPSNASDSTIDAARAAIADVDGVRTVKVQR